MCHTTHTIDSYTSFILKTFFFTVYKGAYNYKLTCSNNLLKILFEYCQNDVLRWLLLLLLLQLSNSDIICCSKIRCTTSNWHIHKCLLSLSIALCSCLVLWKFDRFDYKLDHVYYALISYLLNEIRYTLENELRRDTNGKKDFPYRISWVCATTTIKLMRLSNSLNFQRTHKENVNTSFQDAFSFIRSVTHEILRLLWQ